MLTFSFQCRERPKWRHPAGPSMSDSTGSKSSRMVHLRQGDWYEFAQKWTRSPTNGAPLKDGRTEKRLRIGPKGPVTRHEDELSNAARVESRPRVAAERNSDIDGVTRRIQGWRSVSTSNSGTAQRRSHRWRARRALTNGMLRTGSSRRAYTPGRYRRTLPRRNVCSCCRNDHPSGLGVSIRPRRMRSEEYTGQ